MPNKSPRKPARKTPAAAKKSANYRSSPPSLKERLAKLGLHHDMDFVVHLPLRYEDETRITPINQLQPGRSVLIQGTVLGHNVQYRPRRQLLARLQDASGVITLRWLHFYPRQINALTPGAVLRLQGEVRPRFHVLALVPPH